MSTLHFKYTRRGVHAFTQFFGTILVSAILLLTLYLIFFHKAGGADEFWFGMDRIVAFILGALTAEALAILIPLHLAHRFSETRAYAELHDDRVLLHLAGRTVEIPYAELRGVEYLTIGRGFRTGAQGYRLKLRAKRRLTLTAAYRQVRRARKTGENPDIYAVYQELCRRANIKPGTAALEL
jgi:hypothetical protein